MPIFLARSTSFWARSTTGGSIIFDPRLTTPRPRFCASSKAATISKLSQSLPAKAQTPHEPRESAQDECIPCLQTQAPGNSPPSFAGCSYHLRRQKPNRLPALPQPSRHSPDASARTDDSRPSDRLGHAQIRCVIFQPNGQRDYMLARGGDCGSVLNSQRGLQNRHQPDGAGNSVAALQFTDHPICFSDVFRPLHLWEAKSNRVTRARSPPDPQVPMAVG